MVFGSNYIHFKLRRYSKTEPWRIGPFYGSIIQKCYSKSQNCSKLNEDDTDDRFLLATITRARSSNLQTRLVSSLGISEIPVCFLKDLFHFFIYVH